MINLKHDITIAVSKGRILEEGLILLKKLEIELSYKESTTYRNYLSRSPVTFSKNNLCPTCNQPKLTSTLKQELF